MWLLVGAELGLTYSEVKALPYSEFLRWCAYFEKKMGHTTWVEHLLARVAYEVYCIRFSLGGAGNDQKSLKDFMPPKGEIEERTKEDPPKEAKAITKTKRDIEELKKARAEQSKAAWFGAFGLDQDGNRIGSLKSRGGRSRRR